MVLEILAIVSSALKALTYEQIRNIDSQYSLGLIQQNLKETAKLFKFLTLDFS